MKTYRIAAFAALTCGLAVAAKGTEYYEVEPNDTLAQATVVDNLRHGDRLAGFSFQDQDYFNLRFNDLAMGRIHMHTLWVDFAGSNNLDIVERHFQGSIAVGVPGGFVTGTQLWSDSPNYILKHRWFSIGGTSSLTWGMRSRNGSPSFGDYATRYEHSELVVEDLGVFSPGELSFEQRPHQASIEGSLIVYNDRGNRILAAYGNTVQGPFSVVSEFEPGTYFMAMHRGTMLDHSGALTSTRIIGANAVLVNEVEGSFTRVPPISVTSGSRSILIDVRSELANGQPFGIAWRKFTVVPEPGALVGLGFGIVGMYRFRYRRR